jgi:hypothetical protein
MAASANDVESWINHAIEHNKRVRIVANRITHVISVCDTFDYDDYPVYVFGYQDLEEVKKKYNKIDMQKINEVFDI